MIREAGQTAAPFYWASFIASGRASVALDVPPLTWSERMLTPVRIALASAFVIVALAFVALWRWRARRRAGMGVTENVF